MKCDFAVDAHEVQGGYYEITKEEVEKHRDAYIFMVLSQLPPGLSRQMQERMDLMVANFAFVNRDNWCCCTEHRPMWEQFKKKYPSKEERNMDVNDKIVKDLDNVIETANKVQEMLNALPQQLYEAMKPGLIEAMKDAYKQGYKDAIEDMRRRLHDSVIPKDAN